MDLFDTHCHLDLNVYDADRDEVIARARASNVRLFLNPAYDMSSSARAAALAADRDDTWAAVGIHPNAAADLDGGALAALLELAGRPRVVAIGEIGLDYHWNSVPPDVARVAFERQIALAQVLGKPIIIHCRDAMADVLNVLADTNGGQNRVPVLLHAFSGDSDQARVAVARGYMIGIGGPLTYKRSDELRAIACSVPLGSIVLETDSPYLTPEPYRGRRNEPRHVAEVSARLAVLRGIDPAEIASATTANAVGFFNIHSTLAQP
ncbi:MAG: TatD family hydrolase [Thermoflexales bacterium]